MRRILIVLTLAIVSTIGIAAMPGAANAANCNVTPYAPQPQLYGFNLPTNFNCTDVVEWQWSEHLFRGGYADDFSYSCNGGNSVCDHYVPSGGCSVSCSITANSNVYPCPAGLSGVGPFWWGHWTHFRIRGWASGTWGSWHDTLYSAGTYMTCWN